MGSHKNRDDEIYEKGVRDGQDADFVDRVVQANVQGFSLPGQGRTDDIYNKGFDYGVRNRPEPKRTDESNDRPTDNTSSRVATSNSSDQEAIVKLVAGIAVVVAVVWFIFSVAIPLLIINVAIIALVVGLSQRSWHRVAFPISVLGVALLMLDINKGWATDTLVSNVSFFAGWIPAFFYANTGAGLVAAYLLIKSILDERHPPLASAEEFTKRNVIAMGSLLAVGALAVGLQVSSGFQQRAPLPTGATAVLTGRAASSVAAGTLEAGATLSPPYGQNLRSWPKSETDVVLEIDRNNQYVLNSKSIGEDQILTQLKSLYRARAIDKILYVKADRSITYSRFLTTADIAMKGGACVVALVAEQLPGTESLISGDHVSQQTAPMRSAIDMQLVDPIAPQGIPESEDDKIVLEVVPGPNYLINRVKVSKEELFNRLKAIFDPRPGKSMSVVGEPSVVLQDVVWGIDQGRGAGVVYFAIPPKGAKIPERVPDIDLSQRATTASTSSRCRRDTNSPSVANVLDPQAPQGDQPYFDFQVEKPAVMVSGVGGPIYPDILRATGIGGSVRAQFVVDTSGLAELDTFKVLKSDNDLFSNAVKEALPHMQFVAATIGGRKVRQLLQQPFEFSLPKF